MLSLVREEQLRKGGGVFPEAERQAFEAPVRAAYERCSHPLYAAARLWVDAVVEPAATRDWLALALAMAAAGPREATRFGVFRM